MSSVCGSESDAGEQVAAIEGPQGEFEADDLGHDVKEMNPDKPFYVQNQRFLLTYKTHLDKKAHFAFLEGVNGGKHLHECYCAHEKASSKTNYAHTHTYVDFGRQIKSTSSRKFDFQGIHPNIKFVVTKKRDRLYRYISKEDPELADLAARHPSVGPGIVSMIASKKTIQEAIGLVQNVNDVFGIERLYALTREPEPLMCAQFEPHGWQIPLLRKLEWSADLRSIDNYWEPDGRCGKTTLIKYLVATHPDRFYAISDPGPARDTSTVIVSAQKAGWKGHCMLINLTRDYAEREHIYKFLETLKDGLVTSQKYESATMVFDNPHVIVFSNAAMSHSSGGKLRTSEDRIKNHRIVVTDEDRARWQPPPPRRVLRFDCLAELDAGDEKHEEVPADTDSVFLSSSGETTARSEESAAAVEEYRDVPPPEEMSYDISALYAEMQAEFGDIQ